MDISIFCDESCHLENDESNVMGLGAVWLPKSDVRALSLQLRDIKRRHRAAGELKWNKVSPARLDFYKEVVDWFFNQEDLCFRALIVPNKGDLDHDRFNGGEHDTFYYKMYFSMLNKILSPSDSHSIYIDIKDTRSKLKVAKLRDVLCNNVYDFTGQMVTRTQHVRSHEVELMQVCDLLLGATVYRHRGLATSHAKTQIAERIESKSGRSILHSSPLRDHKFNIFVWQAR